MLVVEEEPNRAVAPVKAVGARVRKAKGVMLNQEL